MEYRKYKTICILDTETTSVYGNSAAPVQIAGVICDNKGKILDSFNERIKTTHVIDPEASKVHGIYARDLINCRKESAVLEDFCAWMKSYQVDVILTYNGETFDRPMLNCRCKALNLPINYFDKENFPGIDGKNTVMDAKKNNLFGLKDSLGRKWKLTLVSELLGIDTENAHDALADVMMLKNVFFYLDPKIHPNDWIFEDTKTTSLF